LHVWFHCPQVLLYCHVSMDAKVLKLNYTLLQPVIQD
jgi:hypothetical protein